MVEWFNNLSGNANLGGGFEPSALEQDILFTLLLSAQVLMGYLVGCERRCVVVRLAFVSRLSLGATNSNAPQGLESVHYKMQNGD